MRTCDDCQHHATFTDEIDGRFYDDGCVCYNHEPGTGDVWHLRCCTGYEAGPEDAAQCPGYSEGEGWRSRVERIEHEH